jgi:hypothetical protein
MGIKQNICTCTVQKGTYRDQSMSRRVMGIKQNICTCTVLSVLYMYIYFV